MTTGCSVAVTSNKLVHRGVHVQRTTRATMHAPACGLHLPLCPCTTPAPLGCPSHIASYHDILEDVAPVHGPMTSASARPLAR
jgi:hypothetical protein